MLHVASEVRMVSQVDIEIHRTLGSLVEGMAGIKEDMLEIKSAMEKQDGKSAESRAAMRSRLEEVADRVGGLETTSAEMKRDIGDMKPVTDQVKRWQTMGIGALGVVGIGGAVLGVSFGDVVKRIFSLLTGGKIG